MGYKIIVDPGASLDIMEGIDWYNKAQPGLGVKFYKQVQAIIRTIRKNPFAFAIRYNNIHTAIINKFPFLVHYFIDDKRNIIVIISVLHSSRNPEIWVERIKE